MNKSYFDDMPLRIKNFLSYQSSVKNKSQLTINEYCLDLRTFFRFLLCEQSNPTDDDLEKINITQLSDCYYAGVTLEDAYRFLAYCNYDRNNHEKARARKVSSIRAFFKYLKTNHIISTNPMEDLESPKLPKSLPKYLTVEQSKALLNAVDGKYKERDYCILTLFLNCGMRLSELVSINYNKIQVHDDSATVIITGKGNKQRTVYLNHACVRAVSAYMRVRNNDGAVDKYALFLSNRGTRISPKTVQHLVEVYLDKAGLEGMGFSTHKLRHTAATLMYQTGKVDLLELKEILGHENLNTTQIYTHLLNESLKAAVDANPLSEFEANPASQKDKSDSTENNS